MTLQMVTFDGVCMPSPYLKIKDDIFNFPIRNQDVWTCGIPKSGTTWMHEMVWLVQNNLDYEGAKESIHTRSPFFDASVFTNNDVAKDVFRDDSVNFVRKKYDEKEQLCIRTHLPWKLLPKEIQEGIKKPKIVYVARNPKDVVVSKFHFFQLMRGNVGTLEEHAVRYMEGKSEYTPYWDHVFGYWKRRNQPNVLFLKYEDMKKDLPTAIRQVAKFLDKPMTEQQIAGLVSHLSFNKMKENQSVNHEDFIAKVRTANGLEKPTDGHFMRSGKPGGYQAEMSKELIEKFDKWIEENTKNTDYVV